MYRSWWEEKDTLHSKESVEENGSKILKKAKGPNATWQSQRRHQMKGYIWLTGSSWYWCNWYTIKAVLIDNMNANIDCEGGLVTLLEKKNLHTISCSLHQNELPFRALFKHLDGTTKGHTTFNGPLGKLCANDCHNLPPKSFSAVQNPREFHFRMKDMDSLSSDQRLLYEFTVGISRGKVDRRFASWKIGPLNQARWLTLAIRLMCLWTRVAYPQNLSTKLYCLINFIKDVYAICWFDIKKSNKFHHQQIYIYNMIDRKRKKPIEVQRITLKNLQYNALALLLENVLFSMVKFDEP